MQIHNEWIVAELKRLDGQGRMTSTVAADIATILDIILFMRGAGTVVRCGDIRIRSLVASCGHMILHGMSTLVHAIDREGQHCHEEKQGKEFYGD